MSSGEARKAQKKKEPYRWARFLLATLDILVIFSEISALLTVFKFSSSSSSFFKPDTVKITCFSAISISPH